MTASPLSVAHCCARVGLVAASILAAALPCRAGWSPAAPLPTATAGAGATLLQDGTILVEGGSTGVSFLPQAALYEPATNTWKQVDPMGQARSDHSATLLGNGQVLVVGGIDSTSVLASAEAYDPVKIRWNAAGTLPQPVAEHTATLLPDGRVLVAGGTPDGSTALAACEIFDPKTNAWTAAASMNAARASHSATLLPSGKVLVAGGTGTALLATCELYDPTANTWTSTGSLSSARTDHTAVRLLNGEVLVAGGSSDGVASLATCELYDEATGQWSAGPSMAAARSFHGSTLLLDGRVLVAGGVTNFSTLTGALTSTEIFDPNTGAWTDGGTTSIAHVTAAFALLANGQVLDAGGHSSGTTNYKTADLYQPPPVGAPTAKLINLSFRGAVGTGANILIAGFATSGSGQKNLLVRGDGPVLSQFGVSGALTNPDLSLFDSGGTLLFSNSGWSGSQSLLTLFGQLGAFALPVGSADSVLLEALPIGSYTAQLAGIGGKTGVGLIEVYDADLTGSTARLVNLSARGVAGSGSAVLIAGFVITGSGMETVLIRGVGPTLSVFGLTGVLPTTQLTLFDSSGNAIVSNSGWGGDTFLSSVFTETGAFALPYGSVDSVLLYSLPPGAYTAQLSGVGSVTGVGLIEIYEVP